jgi:hypothetical protein
MSSSKGVPAGRAGSSPLCSKLRSSRWSSRRAARSPRSRVRCACMTRQSATGSSRPARPRPVRRRLRRSVPRSASCAPSSSASRGSATSWETQSPTAQPRLLRPLGSRTRRKHHHQQHLGQYRPHRLRHPRQTHRTRHQPPHHPHGRTTLQHRHRPIPHRRCCQGRLCQRLHL